METVCTRHCLVETGNGDDPQETYFLSKRTLFSAHFVSTSGIPLNRKSQISDFRGVRTASPAKWSGFLRLLFSKHLAKNRWGRGVLWVCSGLGRGKGRRLEAERAWTRWKLEGEREGKLGDTEPIACSSKFCVARFPLSALLSRLLVLCLLLPLSPLRHFPSFSSFLSSSFSRNRNLD